MTTHQNNRKVQSFTKTKLWKLQKISICNGTKGEFSFLYMFLKKKKKRNQADGLKLVIGSLTFFEHYACNLIVLERVAIVTSRRRMEKAHAFIRNQYFHPKVCVYHCLCCTSLFEVTRDGAPLKVVLWKASLGLQRMKLMGNWRFVVLSAINKSSRAFWKRTPQSGQRGTDGYVSPLLFSFRITL